MEQEKNNKGVIALLVVIIVLLLALVILLATGTISFKSNELKNNQQTTENNQKQNESKQQIKENDDASQEQITQTNDKYTIKLTNDGVDETTLNNLFDIIGIPSTNNQYGSAELNDFLSNNDYNKNAGSILIYTKANIPTASVTVDVDECAPGCRAYTKENAEKLIKVYNLSGTVNDYFTKSSKLKDIYIKSIGGTQVMYEWNGPDAGITHEVISEYFDSVNVRITDKQVIKKYDMNSNGIKTTNQTTVFEFKKDNTGDYYLSSVSVK